VNPSKVFRAVPRKAEARIDPTKGRVQARKETRTARLGIHTATIRDKLAL